MSYEDDTCDVCGQEPKAFTRYYSHEPFVDGRNYGMICWTCACVPKSWYEDENGKIVVLHRFDRDLINTVEEMVEDGWPRQEADISIRAIKKLIKTPKISYESSLGPHVFDQLFFGDTALMELSV